MRLSEFEPQTIRNTLYEADPEGKAYLFGSRADDTKKGGDIDLYFEVSKELGLKSILALEYHLSSQFQTRVDLLVKRQGEADKPIYAIARKGVPL